MSNENDVYYDGKHAYFVPAEESPGTIAEEDDARERQRNGLPAYSPVLNKASLDKKIDAFSEAHKGETAEQIEAACRGEEVPRVQRKMLENE